MWATYVCATVCPCPWPTLFILPSQLSGPALFDAGSMKPVYMRTGLKQMVEATRPNWDKPVQQVLSSGDELFVTDPVLGDTQVYVRIAMG